MSVRNFYPSENMVALIKNRMLLIEPGEGFRLVWYYGILISQRDRVSFIVPLDALFYKFQILLVHFCTKMK